MRRELGADCPFYHCNDYSDTDVAAILVVERARQVAGRIDRASEFAGFTLMLTKKSVLGTMRLEWRRCNGPLNASPVRRVEDLLQALRERRGQAGGPR